MDSPATPINQGHRDEKNQSAVGPQTTQTVAPDYARKALRTPWHLLQSLPDGGPADLAAIGLLALASDIVIESELRRFLPADGVGLYTNRIRLGATLTPENLRELEQNIPAAIEDLVPDDRLDVIAFGCTSGAMAIGPDVIAARIRAARPDVAVTDPLSASLKALGRLGAGRIALITPYPDPVNAVIDDYLERHAPPVLARGSFKQQGDPTISRVSPQAIYNAAVALGREPVDAVFISCTALRCAQVIADIEAEIGKPVVTSNQALAWDALRLAGHHHALDKRGLLFTL